LASWTALSSLEIAIITRDKDCQSFKPFAFHVIEDRAIEDDRILESLCPHPET
jgi:hypothetical protein